MRESRKIAQGALILSPEAARWAKPANYPSLFTPFLGFFPLDAYYIPVFMAPRDSGNPTSAVHHAEDIIGNNETCLLIPAG